MKQDRICGNYISDKGLISKICKKLIQLNSKKKKKERKILIKKMGKGTKQIFFQRRYTNGHHVHEKMLNIMNHQGTTTQNHHGITSHMLEWLISKDVT